MKRGSTFTFALVVCLLASPAASLRAQMGGPGMGGAPNGPAPSLNTPNFRDRVAAEGGPQFSAGLGKLVADVRIMGAETVPENFIYAKLRTRRDREFDPEVVQADVRRLAGTGKFRDVKTFTQPAGNSVLVTFQVFERPTIRYIKFLGNKGLGDKRLVKVSSLELGESINRFAIEEARRKIEEHYRSKGFSQAQIDILEGTKPEDRGVVFIVREGAVERVSKVRFVGNRIASDARLKTQIQSKPGFLWYLFRGKVDRNKIDEDVERLTAYYRNLGYFNARIGRELKFDGSGRWLNLTFVIDEGPRYQVRSVTVNGNQKFASPDLLSTLGLTSGDFFNLGKMQGDVNKLRDIYGSQGHIFADIKADLRFLEEPGALDLTYEIQEGEMFRVGEINIHIAGENPHTRQNVVLNRLSLTPGQIVDIREVRASERRLKYSQLFENNPAQGAAPRIVIRTPELDDLRALAEEGSGGRPGSIRGQSPSSMHRYR